MGLLIYKGVGGETAPSSSILGGWGGGGVAKPK